MYTSPFSPDGEYIVSIMTASPALFSSISSKSFRFFQSHISIRTSSTIPRTTIPRIKAPITMKTMACSWLSGNLFHLPPVTIKKFGRTLPEFSDSYIQKLSFLLYCKHKIFSSIFNIYVYFFLFKIKFNSFFLF